MLKLAVYITIFGMASTTATASQPIESVSGTAPFVCYKSPTKDYTINCSVSITIPPPEKPSHDLSPPMEGSEPSDSKAQPYHGDPYQPKTST